MNRFFFIAAILASICLLVGCLPEHSDLISPKAFFQSLEEAKISPKTLNPDNFPVLHKAVPGYSPLGVYTHDNHTWALFDLPLDHAVATDLQHVGHANLHIFSEKKLPQVFIETFLRVPPELGYKQLGFFAYPLGACLILSIFITLERLFSLRRGVTFPRKVEKALLVGEFPNKKWKKGSAAERIVHVAVHEKASEETLHAYARLEIAAMERGLFLLEVIVAGAPLIGLLGTVTGLVNVFSQMPGGGDVDKSLFSQGISLALLTTMVGLAIALPTLLFNSYLNRVLDKRAASLDWLTARLLDATDRKRPPAEVIR